MGVIHKLKPEIIDFIIENKKNNPSLSCRNLTQLILEKLQTKVSKSSINSIFKENNLSMPIGRRPNPKKKKFNLPSLPVIEGTKAIAVVNETEKPIQKQEQNIEPEIKKEEISSEERRLKEAEEWAMKSLEEERSRVEKKLNLEKQKPKIDDAVKAEEEELKALMEEALRNKIEEEAKRIETEKQLEEEAEKKRLEEERVAQKDAEKKRLEEEKAAQEAAEKKRLEEEKLAQEAAEKKKLEEEKAAREAELKTEKEILAKLAEEEAKKIEAERQLKEEEKLAQEAAEKKRLEEEKAAQEEVERKRLEEEKAAQEAELKAEKERWAKLAEEEAERIKAEKQLKEAAEKKQLEEEKIVLQKAEPIKVTTALAQERVCSGAILLKALDCLTGISKEINEIICKKLMNRPEDFINLTEAAIMRPLFNNATLSELWDLVGSQYTQEKLDNYCAQIKGIENIKSDIDRIISQAFIEARGVKMHFIDGSIVHLDSQMHSTWSTQNIPYDFSSTAYELKNNLNKYFFEGHPLVLFTAPGYDVPSNDFFNLLLNISSTSKRPDTLTLFGNRLEDMDKISLGQKATYSLIFGLWPWQFSSSRKVKRIGDFNLKHIKEIDKDLYLAEIEIDLLRTSANQTISLKGCAIKLDLKEKIRLVVLNSDQEQLNLEGLAGAYLNYWPNLEETFQDFSRKIELFAYVGNVQKFFSKDNFGMELAKPAVELEETFANYIKMLDAYLRWHFLPSGYAEKDFTFLKECFYKLPVSLKIGQNRAAATVQISQGYKYQKDIEYLGRRLNERQINLANGRQIYFETAFK